MIVNGTAFEFGIPAKAPDASLEHFFSFLSAIPRDRRWPPYKPDNDKKNFAYQRKVYLNRLDDGWCGVFISARNSDFNHYVKENPDGTVTIVAEPIGDNPPVELNFFCMREDSRKGIFSNYPGSYPFSLFIQEFWGSYRFFANQQKVAALNALNKTTTDAEIKELYSLRGHGDTASALFDPKDYVELVKELDEIHELRCTTWQTDERDGEPVGDMIKNTHHAFRFVDNTTPEVKVINWIKSMRERTKRVLKNGKTKTNGSIAGERDGKKFTIYFDHNLQDYLSFDYNDIGTIDTNNLAENACLAQMLKSMREQITFRPQRNAK